MRINFGCGARVLDGYFNIDAAHAAGAPRKPELVEALRFAQDGSVIQQIPLPDGCADELMAIHVLEHVYRWECDALLLEWKRLLRPGGRLVLELPDLMKCCENIVSGYVQAGKHPDQAGMWGLYGDPRERNPLMCHRWGWTPRTLEDFLVAHGFVDIEEQPTHWHPVGRERRDMRIVARRGAT